MAKNDEKQVKQNTLQQQGNTNSLFSGAQQQGNERSQEQYDTANARGGEAYSGYKDLASTGGINWDIANKMAGVGPGGNNTPQTAGGGGGGSTGGGGGAASGPQGNFGQFNDAHPYTSGLASTGGVDMGRLTSTVGDYRAIADNPFDVARKGRVEGDINNFRSMEANGGLTDADKNNYLGNGVFKNFTDNGGFSEADANLYRQRATAAVPAIYQNMADEMARRRSVQGGYSPGFSNSQKLLTRTASQDMNNTLRGAEADLQGQIRSNKLAGAQGLSQGQGQFSGLQTGNRLAATSGAQGGEMALEDAINRYKMNALGALTQENQFAEQLAQQGKIAGAGMLTAQGQSLTAADTARAGIGAGSASAQAALEGANQRALLGLQQSGMMGGLAGMSSLYGTNNQAAQNYLGQDIGAIGSQAGANNSYLGGLEKNAEATPGFMDYLSKGLGMAGGIGSAMAGIPGMGGLVRPNSASSGWGTYSG